MAFPEGVERRSRCCVQRAELLLEAQREYFNTISFNNLDNYYWAAASGYRIGHMYDELWHAMMNAPVPANLPPRRPGRLSRGAGQADQAADPARRSATGS